MHAAPAMPARAPPARRAPPRPAARRRRRAPLPPARAAAPPPPPPLPPPRAAAPPPLSLPAPPRAGRASDAARVVERRADGRADAPPGARPRAGAAPRPPLPLLLADPAAAVRAFFLPPGYPRCVTADYLPYHLWSLPCHAAGWASAALAGSSMLAALGVGGAGAAAGGAAWAASIKWVTKDGLGAVGRLAVGGSRLAGVFDEDPRSWRLAAEAVTALGLALEVSTLTAPPAAFVALAGLGTLAKATGRGLSRPAGRVIQTHFAAAPGGANIGAVAAKEEVWEVVGQLVGLAAAVGALRALEAAGGAPGAGAPGALVPLWAAVHAAHVALRAAALRQLAFPYPNAWRGAALAAADVAGAPLPGVAAANAAEPLIGAITRAPVRVELGVTLAVMLEGGGAGEDPEAVPLEELLDAWAGEAFLLKWRGGRARAALWEGASAADGLRAVWAAAWLQRACGARAARAADLRAAAAALEARFPAFEAAAAAAGWDLSRTVLPMGQVRLGLAD
jgi:hypothetical protein